MGAQGSRRVAAMDLCWFIDRVCADGIVAARAFYARPNQADRLQGAIEGYELCQGIEHTDHLMEALHKANARAMQALGDQAYDYRRWSSRVCEIEWVCNVVSAAFVTKGFPPLGPLWPTVRAMIKAANILGTKHGRVWRIRE
jgi:hypothetical protein